MWNNGEYQYIFDTQRSYDVVKYEVNFYLCKFMQAHCESLKFNSLFPFGTS